MGRTILVLGAMLSATTVGAQQHLASDRVDSVPHSTYDAYRDSTLHSYPYIDNTSWVERRLRAYADCVVRHDAAGSGNYVRNSLSDGEAESFRHLRAKTRSCSLDAYSDGLLDNVSIRKAAIADAVRRRIAKSGHL